MATQPSVRAAVAPVSPTAGRPRSLLLVEDVILNQELACAVLNKGGHAVDVVSSGAEAIEAVQAKAYDLVLMDVQMPGMDGITATRRIRDLDHPAASVPIVAMTANVLPHQVTAFKAAGMADHVGKPFKRETLFAAIDRWALCAEPVDAIEPSRHDPETFDNLVDMIGRDTVDRLLVALAKELRQRFGRRRSADRSGEAGGRRACHDLGRRHARVRRTRRPLPRGGGGLPGRAGPRRAQGVGSISPGAPRSRRSRRSKPPRRERRRLLQTCSGRWLALQSIRSLRSSHAVTPPSATMNTIPYQNPIGCCAPGMPPRFMPKMPVTNVIGMKITVTIDRM